MARVMQSQKWCRHCKRYTLHERRTFEGTWGCLLTLLTGGAFFPIWLLLVIGDILSSKWHCQNCGG